MRSVDPNDLSPREALDSSSACSNWIGPPRDAEHADTARVALHHQAVEPCHRRPIRELADLLIDCVQGGASVSFMTVGPGEGIGFCVTQRMPSSRASVLIVAEGPRGIIGTAQLILDVPENQPHRADLSEMLVHRERGVGVWEQPYCARRRRSQETGKTILVLDTANGDAERLYIRHGWCGRSRSTTMHCSPAAAYAIPRSIIAAWGPGPSLRPWRAIRSPAASL